MPIPIHSPEQLSQRDMRKLINGSPPFVKQPAIAAGERYLYAPDQAQPVAKYWPLNMIKVQHDGNADVAIDLDTNPKRRERIEAGTQVILDSIQPFRTYRVENLDGSTSISSGELTITVRRKPLDSDEAARLKAQMRGGLREQRSTMQQLIGLGSLLG